MMALKEHTMDKHTDALSSIAEQICTLWAACGGFGPPHEFNVNRWAKVTVHPVGVFLGPGALSR